MIVDTSAIVAILNREDGWQAYDAALRSAAEVRMSAATYVELSIVVDQRSSATLSRRLDRILDGWGVVIEPLTASQASLARGAHRDYGRGSGHPARLNLGDTFAYALAVSTGQPLLFKGDDFGHTDVEVAATG